MDDSPSFKRYQKDTLNYLSHIAAIQPQIKSVENATDFAVNILFDNTNKIILLSNPNNLTQAYFDEGLYLGDSSLEIEKYKTKDHIIPSKEKRNAIEKALDRELQNRFRYFVAYHICRTCDECQIIATLAFNNPIKNPRALYKKSIHKFEDFVIDFLDKMLPVLAKDKFFLQHSEFATNVTLRKQIIKKQTIKIDESLTSMECKVLYLIAQGSSAKEVAKELNISHYTIKEYLKNIREKLSARTTTHAVSIAIRRQLI